MESAVLGNGMDKTYSVSPQAYKKHTTADRPPGRFSDPSTIVAPTSLQQLISILHEIFAEEHVSVVYVQTLMAAYKSNRADWKKFAKFDPHRYTRNLVDEGNGKFNLMVLCWNEGQGSSIHSHANSHCFLKVLDGNLREVLYEWPETGNGDREDFSEMCMQTNECNPNSHSYHPSPSMTQKDEYLFGRNECTYINDSIGLHRVENISHVDKAITLHLYSPPFQECQCFDERTGRATTSTMTFWSKYGQRTPFGRQPDSVIIEESAENN